VDDEAMLVEVLRDGSGGERGAVTARKLARRALAATGGLLDLARCPAPELEVLLGDARRAKRLAAAFQLGARRAVLERAPSATFGSSADVAAWAEPRLASLEHEELWVLALDGRGGLRGARRAAMGGLHGVGVRAADVLRIALRLAASGFVLVHNHPSGDATPSREDHVFTRSIAKAAAVVGLPLLDHVVVARGGFATVAPDALDEPDAPDAPDAPEERSA
jgi:DNA repair protein RadC